MKRFPILDICARVKGHPEQYEKLRNLCANFLDWDNLIIKAVDEGMAPLLHKHLTESKSAIPRRIQQTITVLIRQYQYKTTVRIQTLKQILALLQSENLTPIIIKGAALCHTIYPDPSLRPMRDMDILLRREEAFAAQKLLQEVGFTSLNAPMPFDHYHLSALEKEVAGVPLCLEIHTGLYPDCPPYYPVVDFETILSAARFFKIDDISALTMGPEDSLHYVYQHGFRMPLTYEPFKLINGADLIGFIEKYSTIINWSDIRHRHPAMYNALPMLHHLAPFDSQAIPQYFVPSIKKGGDHTIVNFTGWPKFKLKKQKQLGQTLPQILKETFFPPSWWLRIYYGITTKQDYLKCIIFVHPRHVFWWAKLYASFLGEGATTKNPQTKSSTSLLEMLKGKHLKKVTALFHKLK